EYFTTYHMSIVPKFWLLALKAQSRIFQHVAVPDILKTVLKGLDVSFELQGKYEPRDYCTQYRESDFAFASRLMEEEGIYYYFKHEEKKHTLVIADSPRGHADVPGKADALFTTLPEDTVLNADHIRVFGKTQELTPGKFTLWDHTFEIPHKHLETEKTVLDSVKVGKVTHKLAVGGNA